MVVYEMQHQMQFAHLQCILSNFWRDICVLQSKSVMIASSESIQAPTAAQGMAA